METNISIQNGRGKHYYANNNDFVKEINQFPYIYENKIVCGDSKDILENLPSSCVDLIFTSPPYNFGMDYDETDDIDIWQKYFDNLFIIFDECIRVLKYGGRFIVNIQPCFSDYVPTHHIISNYMMNKKMIWKGEVVWDKKNYNCKYTAWGSWSSPSNPYMKYTWEFVEIFAKGDLKKNGLRDNIDIEDEEFKEWVVAKWDIAPEHSMQKFEHPAMFPEELAYRAMKLFSYKGDVILDPFCGAGTTCVAAKKTNRTYFGIDISEKYCETAKDRVHSILI